MTHDLDLADVADRAVIVMEQGRLVEQGPPEVLAASGGIYARLRDLDRVTSVDQAGVRPTIPTTLSRR